MIKVIQYKDKMKELEDWLAYNYPGVYRNWKDHNTNEERVQTMLNNQIKIFRR